MSFKPRHARSAQNVLQSPTCQCKQTPKPFMQQQRALHASPQHNGRTRMRREMDEWYAGRLARSLRHPLPGSTNYLSAYDQRTGALKRVERRSNAMRDHEDNIARNEAEQNLTDEEKAERAAQRQEEMDNINSIPTESASDLRPFPLNPHFRSESVLSEATRDEIYEQVVNNGLDITSVSAVYGVDIRRVAAVVRLKTIEKQWVTEGKQLAKPYSEAVLAMVPQTPHRSRDGQIIRHESINDLPVHSATRNQLFWPTSESRSFTREDAAKAFSPSLLPADKRIPHPELVEIEKWVIDGVSMEQRTALLRAKDLAQKEAKTEQEEKQREWEQRTQRVVPGKRWDFKFQDISVESAGQDGRGQHGVGLRYGYAHIDRKRGISKIPTSVE